MEDLKNLKHFLIIRFIWIVVATAVAEALIFYVLEHTLFKALMNAFFHTDNIADIGLAQMGVVALSILAGSILGFVKAIIPQQMIRSLDLMLSAVNRFASGIISLPDPANAAVSDLSPVMRLILALVILGILILVLLPYFVAATVFSGMVIRQFRAIEDREKAEREEYERKRNLMLSDIAHDLRTPMTTVAGYAAALQDGMVSDEKRAEICAAIQTKSARMSDLINLLFDYVKLDSDGFTLTREDTDVCEMVRECVAFLYQDIEDAGMEADIDIPDEPLMINADRIQLSRVITNLITNAIRHNEAGARVGIFLTHDSERIDIMVCDSGRLIPPEIADHIFEPFVTGDESRNSRGGTGLGLSIAHKIVTMHGYRIRLIQKPDIAGYKQAENYSKMFRITIPRG
ncbi:MAG: HAMP domain-containing histidine kinase [Lachnospiraceae bacterium]|nr:HAMP domain-containing histidine kinase [Lachnospiraceae bacterium]